MVERHNKEHEYQKGTPARFEWGPTGAQRTGDDDGCVVVVDVLSFTTAVTLACERGTKILPYPLGQPGADSFADAHHAELASRRGEETPARPWSLSPAALVRARAPERLVLPSPNGATVAVAAPGLVVAACLNNAAAAAGWLLRAGFGTSARPVTVIAAGERWGDGSLRPAVEDVLGAGAVLWALHEAGCDLSAEALVTAQAYRASDAETTVRSSSSALELTDAGYPEDVDMALSSLGEHCVPVLRNGAFSSES